MLNNMISENQLNILFGNSKDFVFLCEKTGDDYVYRYINDMAKKIFQGEDAIGKTVKTVKVPLLEQIIFKYYNLALETNEQQTFQDYSSSGPEVRKYETSVIPIIQSGQRYILATTKEIAFERDIEDKYLFTRSLFFKTFLSTVLVSPDLKLLEANPVFLNTFNLTIETARGKDFLQLNLFDREMMEKLTEILYIEADGQRFESQILNFIDHSGQKHIYMTTFTPLMQEEQVAAFFIILQDVTQHIEQEQLIEQQEHVLQTFKRAMDSAADTSITNVDGIITDVNERLLARTGYERNEVVGHTHQIFNAGYHPSDYFSTMWQTITSGKVWRGEICNRNKAGEIYWNETTIIPLVDVEGAISQYLGVHFDITEKKRIITKLHHVERIFRLITENTNDLMIVTDEVGVIVYVSPSYSRLLGYCENELIGCLYEQLLYEDSKASWQQIVKQGRHQKNELHLELQLISKAGNIFWTEAHCKIAVEEEKSDEYQMIVLSREMTERKEREDKLMFMAYHDGLTNLPNRRYMLKEFPHIKDKVDTNGETLAVIFIDGDDFKAVNDQFGHDVGDEFIKHFSQALQQCVRMNDLVIRVGGDEFIIILTGLSLEANERDSQMKVFVRRVQDYLLQGWEIEGHTFNPTSSMGIAFYPEHAVELEELMDLADKALYNAKKTSKSSYQIYQPNL